MTRFAIAAAVGSVAFSGLVWLVTMVDSVPPSWWKQNWWIIPAMVVATVAVEIARRVRDDERERPRLLQAAGSSVGYLYAVTMTGLLLMVARTLASVLEWALVAVAGLWAGVMLVGFWMAERRNAKPDK